MSLTSKLYEVLTVFKGRIVKVNDQWVVNKEKESHMKDLSGYQPEAPKENTNDPFKYKGDCNILFARIEESEKASEFYKTEVGANIFSVCLEVPEGAETNAKRRIYKKWQIDSEVPDTSKKARVPAEKLKDWLWDSGLSFNNLEELGQVAESMVSGQYGMQAWFFTMKKGEDPIQMSKLIEAGNVTASAGSTNTSSF